MGLIAYCIIHNTIAPFFVWRYNGRDMRNSLANLTRIQEESPKKKKVKTITEDGAQVPMTPEQIKRQEERLAKKVRVDEMRMSPLYKKYSGQLTQAQMLFVHYIVFNGASLEDALMLAYPRTQTWSRLARKHRAYNLLNPIKNPVLRGFYDELRAEFLTRLNEEQVWTLGMASKELKGALSEAKAEGLTKEGVALRLGAITELNRIHGLHKVDVTVGSKQVVFSGEDELSDDVPTPTDVIDVTGDGDGN